MYIGAYDLEKSEKITSNTENRTYLALSLQIGLGKQPIRCHVTKF